MITNMLSYRCNIQRRIMYKIIFYSDKRGKSEVKEYIKKLQKRKDKESNIKFNKIVSYLNMLSKYGKEIGEPYIKHLEDEIWELRPLKDRILFAYYNNNEFIILNIFIKQTRKTPQKEIIKAKKYFKDYVDWREKNEKQKI